MQALEGGLAEESSNYLQSSSFFHLSIPIVSARARYVNHVSI